MFFTFMHDNTVKNLTIIKIQRSYDSRLLWKNLSGTFISAHIILINLKNEVIIQRKREAKECVPTAIQPKTYSPIFFLLKYLTDYLYETLLELATRTSISVVINPVFLSRVHFSNINEVWIEMKAGMFDNDQPFFLFWTIYIILKTIA